MNIGYARVSTDEQSLSLQIQALEAIGCEKIFTDRGVSGNQQSRPGLDKALAQLKSGDKFMVWRLDRLGRSLVHLIRLLERLGTQKICFHSLNENIDTSSSGGRLVFHLMAALAEFERALISERTRAGMAAARANGQRLGRMPSLTAEQCLEARHLLIHQNVSHNLVAAQYNVHPRTLQRLLAKTEHCLLTDDFLSNHFSNGESLTD